VGGRVPPPLNPPVDRGMKIRPEGRTTNEDMNSAKKGQRMDEARTCTFKGCHEPRWAEDPNGLCMFHSPLNGRDDAAARAVWERARAKCQEGRADFRGWHFPRDPDERDFTDAAFQGTARFDDAAFEADVRFERADFHGAASFKGASFAGAGWFENAVFRGAAWFDNASFAGDAGFNAAQFHGPVRFGGVSFQASARFNAATFAANAEFAAARFLGNAWFDDATFQGDARFAAAAFEGKLTIFAAARFLGNAAFTDARFHHVASFKGVGFRGDARFHGATFRGEVSFRGVDWAVGKEIDFDLPFWSLTFRKPNPSSSVRKPDGRGLAILGVPDQKSRLHGRSSC